MPCFWVNFINYFTQILLHISVKEGQLVRAVFSETTACKFRALTDHEERQFVRNVSDQVFSRGLYPHCFNRCFGKK